MPLTLAELSYLLWCTQGIKPDSPPHITRRTVPSAGSRHPFETLLLINRVSGLEPGLYRHVASQHALAALKIDPDFVNVITQASYNQVHVRSCAAMFIWVAVAERTVYRYGARGYRYMHLDAGHVCQNLYLAAWVLGSGVCAIGAFEDEPLNHALELDGETQFVIYMATVGKRA
jgi:SagB-type dehydrogenase family enzyme